MDTKIHRHFLLIFFLLLTVSCAAHRIPLPLNANESGSDSGGIVLGIIAPKEINIKTIEDYNFLIDTFNRSGYFTEVAYKDEFARTPTVLLEVSEFMYDTTEPVVCENGMLMPIGTLGIIPFVCPISYASSYILIDPVSDKKFLVGYRHESKEVVGWIGLLLRILPSWSAEYDRERYYHQAAYSIYSKIIEVRNKEIIH